MGHVPDREATRAAMPRAMAQSGLSGAPRSPQHRERTTMEELIRLHSDPARLGSSSAHVRDQGSINSCTGHWFVRCQHVWHLARGVVRPYGSAAGAYRLGRVVDRIDDRDPLVDEGARPSAVVEAAIEYGVAAEDRWPESLLDVNDEPTPAQVRHSAGSPAGYAHDVKALGRARVLALCAATDEDLPWGAALMVDAPFQEDVGGEVIEAVDLARALGSHMLAGVGYRVDPDGTIFLRVVNSWGAGWRDGGFAWVHERLLVDPRIARDLTVLDVAEAA